MPHRKPQRLRENRRPNPGRNSNREVRTDLFGLPNTFILNETIENDIQVVGTVYDKWGNYGEFRIDGIDVQNGQIMAGYVSPYGYQTAWLTWTIDHYGGISCGDSLNMGDSLPTTGDPNNPNDCFYYYDPPLGRYIGWFNPSPGTQTGAWQGIDYDEYGSQSSINLEGIYNFETYQSEDGNIYVSPSGEFFMEQCQVMQTQSGPVCSTDETYPIPFETWGNGTWDRYKYFVGEVSPIQGSGSSRSRMVTLLPNGYARFEKANPTNGTVITEETYPGVFLPVSAGEQTAAYTIQDGNLTIKRWHPNQICQECADGQAGNCVGTDCMEVGRIVDSELQTPAGAEYTAQLIDDGMGTINFSNAQIVNWNGNLGHFQVATANIPLPPDTFWTTEYPFGWPLESGGYDFTHPHELKTWEQLFSGVDPIDANLRSNWDITMDTDGTWTTEYGTVGTWQIHQNTGIIEFTGTHVNDPNAVLQYSEHKVVPEVSGMIESYDINLNSNSMWNMGQFVGIGKNRQTSSWTWWNSLPFQTDGGSWDTYILANSSDYNFPGSYGFDCWSNPLYSSFACVSGGGDENTIQSIWSGEQMHGHAFFETPKVRGHWHSTQQSGMPSDAPLGFDGVVTWTHDYGTGWDQCGSFQICDSNQIDSMSFSFYRSDSEPPISMGDVNQDGIINVVDLVSMINHILGTQVLTTQQAQAADINGDGLINVIDVVGLMNQILSRGDLSQHEHRAIKNLQLCLNRSQSGNIKRCIETMVGRMR